MSWMSYVFKGVGLGFDAAAGLEQGRTAEQEGKARAEVDIRKAKAVRESAVEQAKITSDAGRRFDATQKSQAADGGIKINVGSPLVIATETRAAITKDIGWGLRSARFAEAALRSSAYNERTDAKAAKKESKIKFQQDVTYGSISYMMQGRQENWGQDKAGSSFSPNTTSGPASSFGGNIMESKGAGFGNMPTSGGGSFA